MEISTIIILCMAMLGIIIASAFLEDTSGVSIIGVILMLGFFSIAFLINNKEIAVKTEQQTYHKAIVHNPYKMTILYDATNSPRDTIYELKE